MKEFSQAKKLTYFSILAALTVILQVFGNTVRIAGIVTLNFSLIPIVLSAILLGALYGTALGTITGLVILLNNGILGADGFTNVLFATDPVIIILVCIFKTAVAGGISGLLFKTLKKFNVYVAVLIAAGVVPIINSGLFIVGMLMIVPSLVNVGFIAEGANAFAVIVIGFVGLNFVFEFLFNLIMAPALYRVISVVNRSYKSTKEDTDDNKEE